MVFLGFSSLAQGPAGPGPGLAPEPALGPHDGQRDPKGRPKGARGHPFSKRLLQKRRHFSEKRPAGGKIAPETRTFTKTKCHFSEKRPAGGRIAPETRTFTKTYHCLRKLHINVFRIPSFLPFPDFLPSFLPSNESGKHP